MADPRPGRYSLVNVQPMSIDRAKKGGDPRRTQKIEVYWSDIAKHILRRAPAGAVHNRKGGHRERWNEL